MVIKVALVVCFVIMSFTFWLRRVLTRKRRKLVERAMAMLPRLRRLVEREGARGFAAFKVANKNDFTTFDYLVLFSKCQVDFVRESRGLSPITMHRHITDQERAITFIEKEVRQLEQGMAEPAPRDADVTRPCRECCRFHPVDEMIPFENTFVCTNCKDSFFQKIREGIDPDKH